MTEIAPFHVAAKEPHPFDMHAGGARESIHHHEEFLFSLAAEHSSRYPVLLDIWESFYKDPRLHPDQAGNLVHELIELLSSNGGLSNKPLAITVSRLLPFFSTAYRNGETVLCNSD